MIYLLNLVFQPGLDLNVEAQTVCFFRASAQNRLIGIARPLYGEEPWGLENALKLVIAIHR